jgi:hypothetical protein
MTRLQEAESFNLALREPAALPLPRQAWIRSRGEA